jgi:hypothetical protein
MGCVEQNARKRVSTVFAKDEKVSIHDDITSINNVLEGAKCL